MKLVNIHDSKSCAERLVGSTPTSGTKYICLLIATGYLFLFSSFLSLPFNVIISWSVFPSCRKNGEFHYFENYFYKFIINMTICSSFGKIAIFHIFKYILECFDCTWRTKNSEFRLF